MKRTMGTFLLLALPAAVFSQENTPIKGIGPTGPIVKLHTGFKFTEGPASDGMGNVYFSDIPDEKIYKVDAAGKLSTFTDKSGHANGLMFRSMNTIRGIELVACEMDGQLVAWSLKGKPGAACWPRPMTANASTLPMILSSTGKAASISPILRSAPPDPKPQDKLGVYYVDPLGKAVTRLIDDLPNPNGVKLSPDEKTLYVIPTGPADMMAYPVEAPGKIGKGRVFCTLKGGGGDGMTVDEKGNLYITSILGLQVFDPTGKMLGIITLPEQPSNVTFGGPGNNTLYVTARSSLYTVPMAVKGHVYPAGK